MIPDNRPGGSTPQFNGSYPMGRLQSSAYAAPLGFNQPTEIVGGYDSKINPMTGEESPETNFAGGGEIPRAAGLASFVQSKGRGNDTVLVHMTPGEVKGLQSLALAHGGSLTINPETGLPEAGFLSKILPTLLGFGLNAIFPGLGVIGSSLLVGAGETIRTGDLGKGLMAGLGAYGGAGLGSAVSTVGQEASKAALTNAGVDAAKSTVTAGSNLISQTSPEVFKQALAPEAFKNVAAAPITGANLSSGMAALQAAPGTALKAVGSRLGASGIGSLGSTALNVMSPEMKAPKGSKEDNLYYISGGYSDEEGFAPGQYTRTYPGLPPPGMAEGGDVEKAKAQALESFAMAPQQAAPSSAGLQQYMSNLNRFLAGADKAAPTYIAPPPKPVAPPPSTPVEPTPVRPPTFSPIDFSNIDFSNLRGFGFDPEQVRRGLRNFGYTGDFGPSEPAAGEYRPPVFDSYNPYTGEINQDTVDAAMQPPAQPVVPPTMVAPPAYQEPVYQERVPQRYEEPVREYDRYWDRGPVEPPAYQPPQPPAAEEREYIPREPETAPIQEFLGTPYMPQPEIIPAASPQMPEERSYIPQAPQPEVTPVAPPQMPETRSYIPREYQEYAPETLRAAPQAERTMDYGLAAVAPRGERALRDRQFEQIQDIPSGAMGEGYNFGFAGGGTVPTMQYAAAGKLLRGPGDGMSDDIPANIGGTQEARLADGEFVIPADVVSHLGNGSSEAGSKQLYAMMDRIRMARTGRKRQAPEVDAEKFLPA